MCSHVHRLSLPLLSTALDLRQALYRAASVLCVALGLIAGTATVARAQAGAQTGAQVSAQPVVITQQPVSTLVTLGQPVTFQVQATGAVSYQWIRDYTPIVGATSSSYSFLPQAADTGHEFSVVIWGSGSMAFSQGAWLHVAPRTDIPTVTDVEQFGVVSAAQAGDSFGLGVNADQDWQYAAVAAMGGKWVRADACEWQAGEIQLLPSNTSGGFDFTQSATCLAEVQSAKRYGLHLNNVAYWGPPHGVVAQVAVSADVPAGSMSVPVNVPSGTLSGYPARDLVLFDRRNEPNPFQLHLDGGAPVDSATPGAQGFTIGLTQPTVVAIPAGAVFEVQALLYPPVLIDPSPDPLAYLKNPSVQAWTRYVGALQNFIKDQGVTGTVELWNEPENSWELWDSAPLFYSAPPAHFQTASAGDSSIYLAFAATTLPPVSGVTLLNGWSDTSGYSALTNPSYAQILPVSTKSLSTTVGGNAIHPYGNNPEEQAWNPAVVQQGGAQGQENIFAETPIGGNVAANFKCAAYYNALPGMGAGVPVTITETGIQKDELATETEDQRTRFDVRQFLTFAGLGVKPILFFKAGGDAGFEWFGEDDAHTPRPVVAAFTGLLADIHSIGGTPASTIASTPLPQVSVYKGYYPLATTSFVGAQAGASNPSVLFFSWQKTYTVASGDNYGDAPNWLTLASPAAVPLQLTIPAGYTVQSVVDVDTQQSVGYTLKGNVLTYPVADDPIEVFLVPVTLSTPQLSVSPVVIPFGSAAVSLSASVLFSGSTPPSSVTLQVNTWPAVAASCAVIATGVEQCTATYPMATLPAGSYTVTASTMADSVYNAGSGAGSLTLTLEQPLLSVQGGTASLNNVSVPLSATLSYTGTIAPAGAVSFALGTGSPLTGVCSGATSPLVCTVNYPLASLSAGQGVVSIAFAGDRNYAPASIAGSMTILPATASLSMADLSMPYAQTGVTIPLTVQFAGTRPPTGVVTVTIDHGPALASSCIGATSPLTCTTVYPAAMLTAGTHTIQASLAADANYSSTSATANLTVQPPYQGSSIWIANGNGTMTALTPAGVPIAGGALTGGGVGAAVDSSHSVWSLDASTGSVWKYASSGSVLLAGAPLAGVQGPTASAVDGAGTLWIVDGASRLSAVNMAGTTLSVASYSNGLAQPTSVHVDASGNLWITNAGDDSLTEVIGIATPAAGP